jgi:hypothetical protein
LVARDMNAGGRVDVVSFNSYGSADVFLINGTGRRDEGTSYLYVIVGDAYSCSRRAARLRRPRKRRAPTLAATWQPAISMAMAASTRPC